MWLIVSYALSDGIVARLRRARFSGPFSARTPHRGIPLDELNRMPYGIYDLIP